MCAENHQFILHVARIDCWLQRLLIWTPGQIDLIKTVALLLMVADHINLLYSMENEWLRLAGRGAFPLFGLAWSINLSGHPCIPERALKRLWVWAVVAQGGWMLAGLRMDLGNILFAFAVSGQVLALIQRRGPQAWPVALMLILVWLPFSEGSYGLAGVIMLLLACGVFMVEQRGKRMGLALCLAMVIFALNVKDSCVFAIAGLVIPGLILTVISLTAHRVSRFWPREFFPLFYTVHLAVLGLLAV